MEPVRITQFVVKDFKGVELVEVEVNDSGLFVIGGECDQGKTSILDGIMACLGGERFVPDGAVRDGAQKGEVTVKTSNGLVVRRSFTPKGSYLTVSDPAGMKGNQGVLNKFISLFALDAPRFLALNNVDKVKALLQAIGVDLSGIQKRKESVRQDRLVVGRNRDRIKALYESMPYDEAAGLEDHSVAPLIAKLNEANEQVRANEKKVDELDAAEESERETFADIEGIESQLRDTVAEILKLQEQEAALRKRFEDACETAKIKTAKREELQQQVNALVTPDVSSIDEQIEKVEQLNRVVAANRERQSKHDEYVDESLKYKNLTEELENLDAEQSNMVSGAENILPGLGVSAEGELTYNGRPFSALSHSDQLIVTVSICGALNKQCGFVLLDKLEAMDAKKLDAFGKWVKHKGMQVIATRVSTGPENSIIIARGKVLQECTSDVLPTDDHADEVEA